MKFPTILVAALLFSTASYAEAPRVVTDIAPIHSLVAQVMEGVGEPKLLIPARVSPHGHALKVSEARMLADAELVFWVGESLTPWLEKALDTLADDANAVELLELDGIELLGGDEDDEEDHGEEQHGEEHHEDEEHHDEDEHHHGDADPHIWLDPQNAANLVAAIADTLAEADPENKDVYLQNAAKALDGLSELHREVAVQMEPLKGRGYIVFHDGYRYFENRFGLGRAIAISGGHAVKPGARRVSEVRRVLRETSVRCVFAERQFGTKSVDAIVRGTEARKAELDPLGDALTPGADLYAGLIRAMAKSFSACQ